MIFPQSDRRQEVYDFRMTELEESLAGEGGEAIKLEILSRLVAKAQRLRDIRQAGVTPSEFEKVQTIYDGLAAAYEIIKRFPAGGRKAI